MNHKVDLGNGITLDVVLTEGIPDDQMMIVTPAALQRAYKEWSQGEPITPPLPEEAVKIINLARPAPQHLV